MSDELKYKIGDQALMREILTVVSVDKYPIITVQHDLSGMVVEVPVKELIPIPTQENNHPYAPIMDTYKGERPPTHSEYLEICRRYEDLNQMHEKAIWNLDEANRSYAGAQRALKEKAENIDGLNMEIHRLSEINRKMSEDMRTVLSEKKILLTLVEKSMGIYEAPVAKPLENINDLI